MEFFLLRLVFTILVNLWYNYFGCFHIMDIFESFIKEIINVYSNNPKLLFGTIILLILSILLEVYYTKFRGFMGEFWVKIELKKLPKNRYIVLNNIMIKDERRTHQIDHIVLSNYGIFVLEMKNYYGLIKGREYDNKWCQYLGRTKNYFLNPIHQNYGHIKSLSELLGINENKFISIICFSNQVKLDVNCKSIVIQLDYLVNEILKFDEIILDDGINEIVNIIASNNIIDKTARKQHIRDIRNRIKYTEELSNDMICPKCGNRLIEKNGKYGNFIGCSNFPKCKYIKK